MFQSRKILMLLASLLAAGLLWLYVVTTVAPEIIVRISNIPVTLDGSLVLEERGLVVTDQDIDSVSLEISTSRANLSKLNAETIRISADASKIRVDGAYELNYTITFPDTVRSNDVDILRKSSDNIHITVSQLKTKSVPVRLKWTGTVQEGYLFESESVAFDPAEITLVGPDFEVDPVQEAVVSCDISDRKETRIETLPVSFVDDKETELTFSEFTTASATEVQTTLPVTCTRELELTVNLEEGGGVRKENAQVEIEPSSIKVKGSAEVLNNLGDSLEIGTVELSSILKEATYQFNLTLPAGVTNMSGDDVADVKVTISDVANDTIYVSDIRLLNAPEGFEAKATSRTVKVTVRGTVKEIKKLKEEKNNGIYILVDLKNYDGTGEFTVTGKVVNDNHPSIGVKENVEIGVSITAPVPVTEPEPDTEATEPED